MSTAERFCRHASLTVTALLAVAVMSMAASTSLLAQARPVSSADGGVRVGDRIILKVDGETQLSDTFTVTTGPSLVLPVVGTVSLAGVRRENLEKQIAAEIGKFIRNPIVKAKLLLRLSVVGEVGKPGFYAVPIDALVNDVLMIAGGPSKEAKMEAVRIQRNGVVTWPRDSLKVAMAQGFTLTQLDVQPEDEIFVPKAFDAEKMWRVVALVLTIPAVVLGLTRMGR